MIKFCIFIGCVFVLTAIFTRDCNRDRSDSENSTVTRKERMENRLERRMERLKRFEKDN